LTEFYFSNLKEDMSSEALLVNEPSRLTKDDLQ